MSDIMNKVIRERQTETQLRRVDMHEIVDLIHGLEGQVSASEQERDETRREAAKVGAIANELHKERDALRAVLKTLVSFDDLMKDETWDEHATHAGAYYAYYKGTSKTWDEARALLLDKEGGAQ